MGLFVFLRGEPPSKDGERKGPRAVASSVQLARYVKH